MNCGLCDRDLTRVKYYRCVSCPSKKYRCSECIVAEHAQEPLHKAQVSIWTLSQMLSLIIRRNGQATVGQGNRYLHSALCITWDTDAILVHHRPLNLNSLPLSTARAYTPSGYQDANAALVSILSGSSYKIIGFHQNQWVQM